MRLPLAAVIVVLATSWTAAAGAQGEGGGDGICGSTLSTGDEGVDGCLSALCCGELEACTSTEACAACLVGEGTDCNENAAYQTWQACSDARCADEICGTGLSFFNDNGGTAYECNACAAQCCSCARGCVGKTTPSEVDTCLDCLAEPDICVDGAVEIHVRNFRACVATLCASECGDTDPAMGTADACMPDVPATGGQTTGSGGSGGQVAVPAPPQQTTTCSCTAPGRRTRGGGTQGRGWSFLALLLYSARRMKRSSRVSRCGATSTTCAPSSSARFSTSDTAS